MKGILKSLLIVLACVLLLSACANEQKEHYKQAAGHFEDGWYDQAMQYFERAGEYRDAKERYRESAYRAGLEYMNEPSGAAESGAEGNNFFRARYYFMHSEGYSDADQLAQECIIAGIETDVEQGRFNYLTGLFTGDTASRASLQRFGDAEKRLAAAEAIRCLSENTDTLNDTALQNVGKLLFEVSAYSDAAVIDQTPLKERLYAMAVASIEREMNFNLGVFAWLGDYKDAAEWYKRGDRFDDVPVIAKSVYASQKGTLGSMISEAGLFALVSDGSLNGEDTAIGSALKTLSMGDIYFTDDLAQADHVLTCDITYTSKGTHDYTGGVQRTYYDTEIAVQLLDVDLNLLYTNTVRFPYGTIPDEIRYSSDSRIAEYDDVYPDISLYSGELEALCKGIIDE